MSVALPNAIAHTDTNLLSTQEWTFDPWVWLPISIGSLWYFKGSWMLRKKRSSIRANHLRLLTTFGVALIILFFALIWPLDKLSTVSFAAHMIQHMLLIVIAAPLLILAEPSVALIMALPQAWRRSFSALHARLRRIRRIFLLPQTTFTVHAAIIWIWHAPLLFELALHWQWMHAIEHFTLFGSALWFWTSLKRAGRRSDDGYGVGALWILAMLIHTGLLGALITFARQPLYVHYATSDSLLFSLTPLEDQQLAGLLMWIPVGICYLLAGILFALAWLKSAEDEDKQLFY
ncbi:cytochrome c oxidase assembly protein [Nitrosococcus wardiae]|nr:cytochrome c oxidase assembly protein [Nitrosococcus wardiae]